MKNITNNKVRIVLILCLFFFTIANYAQTYQWQWAKAGGGENKLYADVLSPVVYNTVHYHEEVVSLKNTSENHTYILSHVAYGGTNFGGTPITTYHRASSSENNSNIFLGKVDCEGNYLWHKIFGGGAAGGDYTSSMGIDASDNVYVGMMVFNRGYHDSLNVPASTYRLPVHFDTDSIMDPIPRNWGGVELTNVASPAHKRLALIKYNSDGVFQWLRMPQSDSLTLHTNLGIDYGVSVEPNGTTHWMVSLGNGSHFDGLINISGLPENGQRIYILKYDSNGESLGYFEVPFTSNLQGYQVKMTNFTYDPLTEQYYFASCRDINNGTDYITMIDNQEYPNSLLICFNSSGQVLWTKTGNNIFSALVNGLLIDEQSNVYVSGIGTKFTVLPNGDNGPLNGSFGGYEFTTTSNRKSFVIKYDSSGNLLWGSNAGVPGSLDYESRGTENAQSMTINGDELAVGTGFFNQLWGAYGVSGQPASGAGTDPVLIRLNKNTGVCVGAHRIFGANGFSEGLTAVETDQDGNYLVGGYMRSFLFASYDGYVDPIVGQLNKAAPGGGTDFYVAKLGKTVCGTASTELFDKFSLNVYPNPTSDKVYVETTEPLDNYEVYNILGQRLKSRNFAIGNEISLKELSKGTYFVKIRSQLGSEATVKVIKK